MEDLHNNEKKGNIVFFSFHVEKMLMFIKIKIPDCCDILSGTVFEGFILTV